MFNSFYSIPIIEKKKKRLFSYKINFTHECDKYLFELESVRVLFFLSNLYGVKNQIYLDSTNLC